VSLVQALPEGPLGIVGDIHGEYEALHGLLRHLGSNHAGQHSEGRQLVFVGDFFDRGPHSPRVFEKVRTLVDSGRAFAVLGNHEINLLRNDPKDGAGWFFESRTQKDQEKYAPFDVASAASRREIMCFLTTLPLALERPDLRVVHAAWLDTSIDAIRGHTTESLGSKFDRWQAAADQLIEHNASCADRWVKKCWPGGIVWKIRNINPLPCQPTPTLIVFPEIPGYDAKPSTVVAGGLVGKESRYAGYAGSCTR